MARGKKIILSENMERTLSNYEKYLLKLSKSEKTIVCYISTMRNVTYDLGINKADEFDNIKKMDWLDYTQELLNEQNKKPSTINKMIKQVSSFYSYLEVADIVQSNPCYRFPNINKEKSSEYKDTIIKKEEVKAIKETCKNLPIINRGSYLNKRTECLINLVFDCGMRIDELSKIKIEDLDIENREIGIRSKGHDNIHRYNFYSTDTQKLIKELIAFEPNREYLFTPHDNYYKRLATQSIREEWYTVLELSNVRKYRFHDIRHVVASMLISKGYAIEKVAKFLGHSNISTIQKYYLKPIKEDLKEMADENLFD